ncbi:MAG: hypothetical protein ABIQ99_07720 [Thermoflexales bacterium]
MPASKIKADYEKLRQIAHLFGREANATRETIQLLSLAVSGLESGDWIGPGALTFFVELRADVLPSLHRLGDALAQAQRATLGILAIARQAEADAAEVLRAQAFARADAPIDAAVAGMAGLVSAAIPPRIYIVNGINNRRADAPEDALNPSDSMVKLRAYLIRNGCDPDQVVVTAPVFNTNLHGTQLEGTRFGQPSLQPANWLTSAFAWGVNTITGAALGAANTAIGVGQVAQEYASSGASQTQRIDQFVRDDLARHPLLPDQGIVLLGHSGGAVIAANLAPRLEGERVAREVGSPTPLDVLGVATLGAPLANYDAVSKVAPVVMLRHVNDLFGLPVLRSDEARSEMAGALLAFAAGPARLGTTGAFVGFDLYARNAGASAVVDLTYAPGPDGPHRSYWQDSSTVYQALFDGLGLPRP